MNQKKYWLRGGIIAILVVLIACLEYVMRISLLNILALPLLIWPDSNFLLYAISLGGHVNTSLVFLFLLYFIIGSFFGWLYGKIKNRRIKKLEALSPKP